jgi:hypothetical protein
VQRRICGTGRPIRRDVAFASILWARGAKVATADPRYEREQFRHAAVSLRPTPRSVNPCAIALDRLAGENPGLDGDMMRRVCGEAALQFAYI